MIRPFIRSSFHLPVIPALGILSVCLLLLLSTGCKPSENIQYGAQGCFVPDKGEKMTKYSKAVLETYETYCLTDTAEMLLNRSISGIYTTYISMLLYHSPPDFKERMLKDGYEIEDEQIFGTKKAVYYGFLAKKEDIYMYRVVFTEPNFDHLIIIDFLDADKDRIQLLFDDNETLISKINCGKAG